MLQVPFQGLHPPFLDSPWKDGNAAKLGRILQGLSQAISAFTGSLTPGFYVNHSEGAIKEGDSFRCLQQILECASPGEWGDEILQAVPWKDAAQSGTTPDNEAVLWCGASWNSPLLSHCASAHPLLSHNYTYVAWQFHEDIFILLVKQQKIPVFLDLSYGFLLSQEPLWTFTIKL